MTNFCLESDYFRRRGGHDGPRSRKLTRVSSGFIAINHVGISVRDLAEAQRFWCEGLGAVDHGGWSWPVGTAPADASLATDGTAASVALLRTDTAFLELFAFSSPRPEAGRRGVGVPGVTALTWAVPDIPETLDNVVYAGGTCLSTAERDVVRCPDGTIVQLVERAEGGHGLVGVRLAVPDPAHFVVPRVPGPVRLDLERGADASPARPTDLGVNHLCFDVDGIDEVRSGLAAMSWHHDVTESSGGKAAVSYGTTSDGILIELLESRSSEAHLARCHLAVG